MIVYCLSILFWIGFQGLVLQDYTKTDSFFNSPCYIIPTGIVFGIWQGYGINKILKNNSN